MKRMHEIEKERLVESIEKKEFTLQLLEQRLFDCEKFLRKWGRDDPFIREQLKTLRINPDLNKKRITSVIEQNSNIQLQLKEAMDEIELLHDKLTLKQRQDVNQTLEMNRKSKISKVNF